MSCVSSDHAHWADAQSLEVSFHSMPSFSSTTNDAVAHLQALIRIRTVNPPGDEIVAATYLDTTLRAAGVETTLLVPAPGRAAIVARLRGDGSLPPVLLLAHMDTVSVDLAQWTADPFGGELRDGYVYGRGAIDDKGMLAANLTAFLAINREVLDAGGTLRRDVIFAATSDEETGGPWGLGWLLDNHPDLVRAEFCINEGGRVRVVDGRPLYAAVQCAEKVNNVVRLVARGTGGHAAVPLPDNAATRLARAVARVGAYREPVRLTSITRHFFGGLARAWPDATQAASMRDVASGRHERVLAGARVLRAEPAFDAVLRAGLSAVGLAAGGAATNVIPAEATATYNIRTLPDQSLDDVLGRMARAIDDDGVAIEVVGRGGHTPPSDPSSSLFAALAAAIDDATPGLTVVPYLSTGATDNATLRRAGIPAFGILPFPLDATDEGRMHGHDERVPVAALEWGVRVLLGTLMRVAGPLAAAAG
jgi:acetylornithine deacetylase/succinyl-diaminopimelate desuccinylase-like protein